MDHFELVSEYAQPAISHKPSSSLSKASRKETNVRPFLALPVRVRHLRWQYHSTTK